MKVREVAFDRFRPEAHLVTDDSPEPEVDRIVDQTSPHPTERPPERLDSHREGYYPSGDSPNPRGQHIRVGGTRTDHFVA